ncbi:hypothetical protein [Methylobacterium sp. Gmos1]
MIYNNEDGLEGAAIEKTYSSNTIRDIIIAKIAVQEKILSVINFSYSVGSAVISIVYTLTIWAANREQVVRISWCFIVLLLIFCIIMLYYGLTSRSVQSEMEQAVLRDYSEPSATTEKLLKDVLIEIKQTASRPVFFKSVPNQKIVEFIIWTLFMTLVLALRLYE